MIIWSVVKLPKIACRSPFKDIGMSFQIFVPILENEFTWIESVELCV